MARNATVAINALDQTVNNFKSRIDVKVSDVNTSTANIQATTNQIYENIEKFKVEMIHGEDSQIAHENVLRIDQIIKEQFGNHVDIRRTVMGVVHDFDINLVRNSTIQELSEELWITSSRYWLSYALIAISAWVNNYPEVARNALYESKRRDAIKTTLFFCLTNLRFERLEAAKAWFFEYFKTLDPTMLQQETAVLLQAFLNGAFGKDKELEHSVIDLIEQWISIIHDDIKISEELLGAYEAYIENLPIAGEFSYESLVNFCKNSDEVRHTYENVSKFIPILEFVKSLDVDAAPQTDDNYKERIDSILMSLISNYDAEELELKKQQEYYRFIIEAGGVIEEAEARYLAMEELENSKNFNIGRQMIKWAIYDNDNSTDIQVRKFGFQNTKAWFKDAVNRFADKVQDENPNDFKLAIDGWETVTDGTDSEEQTSSLKTYFDNNKMQLKFVNAPNIITVVILVLTVALAFVTPFSLIATGLCIGFLVYRIIDANKKYPIRVKAALDNLDACFMDINAYKNYYSTMLAKKEEIIGIAEFL